MSWPALDVMRRALALPPLAYGICTACGARDAWCLCAARRAPVLAGGPPAPGESTQHTSLPPDDELSRR